MTIGGDGSTQAGTASTAGSSGTSGDTSRGGEGPPISGTQGSSQGGGSGLGQQSGTSGSGLPANLNEFQRKCLSIVDEYRAGSRSHDSAFVHLHKYVYSCPPALGDLVAAFGDYSKMLDDHRKFLGGSDKEPASGAGQLDEQDRTSDDTDAEVTPKGDKRKCKHSKAKRSHRRKPGHSDGSSSSSSGTDDSSDDDKAPAHLKDFVKRRRDVVRSSLAKGLPGGLFAFADSSSIIEESLDPILRNTRRHYAAWKQDLTVSFEIVASSVDRPPFPDDLWKQLLAGQDVDFERLWADKISIHPGSSKPVAEISSGTIRDSGDWGNVWGIYSDAVLFLMPDRRRALERYARHIRFKFKTIKPEFHSNVIAYDSAVHKRVARQGNLMLSDIEQFDDLRDELLSSFGVGTADGGNTSKSNSSKSGKRGKTSEVCRRFNKGFCDQTDRKCNYRHTCSICNSLEHPAKECPQKAKHQ